MDPSSGGAARRDSLRHVRRMSNWTAAILIVGTGTAAVTLAHQASQTMASPATAAASPAAGTAAGTTGTPAAAGPRVTHSVATTTASGVTVPATTRTVNGRTVVTRVSHAPAGGDS
jgi:hypothetical protein